MSTPEGLPELPMGEDGFDGLALNYRTAHTMHAQAMWEELERFVQADRLSCYQAALERAAVICDGYSKHLIATGKASTPSEWAAHGAESCANLLRGLNEFGDPPESEHYAGGYTAAIRPVAAAIRSAKP